MLICSQIPDITLGELKRKSLETQKAEIKNYLLNFRGEVSIKINDTNIPANIQYAEYDKKNERVILFTNLRAKDDNQRLVIDVYIDDEIAREWAMGMGENLEGRNSENANHAAIILSLKPNNTLH